MYTTCCAREYLHAALDKVGADSALYVGRRMAGRRVPLLNVFSDTDSIILRRDEDVPLHPDIKIGSALGEWEHEPCSGRMRSFVATGLLFDRRDGNGGPLHSQAQSPTRLNGRTAKGRDKKL